MTRGGTAGGGEADWSVRGFAVMGAGLFALNPLVWTYSTHAEVFALNNLLVFIFFFALNPLVWMYSTHAEVLALNNLVVCALPT